MGIEAGEPGVSVDQVMAEPVAPPRAAGHIPHIEAGDERMLSPEAARQLISELRLRQVDLEMRNAELRGTQRVLKASQARYHDLYDRAPVGYLALSEEGLILEANLTAATLLGVPRDALLQQPLAQAILPEDQDIYTRHRSRLLETSAPQVCELRMLRQGAQVSHFWARLESILVQDAEGEAPGLRLTLSDITEPKEIEEKALQRHQFLQHALDSLSHPFYVINVHDFTVEAANKAAHAGRMPPGITCYALLHGRDQPCEGSGHPCPLHEVLATRRPVVLEHVHLDQDGGFRNVEVHGFPITDSQGNVVQMIEYTLDITDHKRAEAALRASEEKLRKLFEILPVGISVLDSSRNIQLTNPALARILGLSQDQLQSGAYAARTYLRNDGTEMPPGDFPSVRAARERQPVRDVEIGLVKEDGEEIWTNVSAVPLPYADWSVIVTTADITRRKRAEIALQQVHDDLERRVHDRTAELLDLNRLLRAEIAERERVQEDLRASEERFRQLADNTDQVFWVADLATRQPLYISQAYEDLWGRAPQSLYDHPSSFYETIHPEDRQRVELALDQASQEEQVAQFQLVRPDGSLRWAQLRVFPVRDAQGRVYRLAGIAEDISDQVQAMQLLERRVAERTHQLSALLRIASGMTLTLELGSLLEQILDGLEVLVQYDAAVIYELQGEELVAVAHRGRGAPVDLVPGPLCLAESAIAQSALSGREPLLLSHVQARTDDSLLVPVSDWASCGIAAPLAMQQRALGLLVLYSRLPESYSPQQAELLLTLANQAAVGIENAHLYEQLPALAVIEERQRLARDLHDSVTQTLFSANIIAETLLRTWDQDPEGVRRRLPQLHRLTSAALAEMRTLLLELRPAALAEMPMSDLLRQAVDAFSGRTRTAASLSVAGQHRLPEAVQIALYRIVQEALNNVAKHARATEATIHYQSEPGGVTLRIRDNGRGFDPDLLPPGSMGINILRERARAIGATLSITSQPGDGTEIMVVWTEAPAG